MFGTEFCYMEQEEEQQKLFSSLVLTLDPSKLDLIRMSNKTSFFFVVILGYTNVNDYISIFSCSFDAFFRQFFSTLFVDDSIRHFLSTIFFPTRSTDKVAPFKRRFDEKIQFRKENLKKKENKKLIITFFNIYSFNIC
jgi:hypothetical protein